MYIYKSKLNPKNILNYKSHPLAKSFLELIDAECDKYRGTDLLVASYNDWTAFDRTGDRSAFQRVYFTNRKRLTVFMLRAMLYNEQADLDELTNTLWQICNEYSWALPAHMGDHFNGKNISNNTIDLFATGTGQTICDIVSLLGDRLDPFLVEHCVREVFRRIIEPFENDDRDFCGLSRWDTDTTNWAAVCSGNVGMCALTLIEDEDRLNKIITRCIQISDHYISGISDDGVSLEGIGYFNYAMQYYIAFDELLRERTGKSIITDEAKLAKMALFPSAVCLDENTGVMFSDTLKSISIRTGVMCKLHERFNAPMPPQGVYRLWDECSRSTDALRTLAWFKAEYFDDAPLPSDYFSPNAEWAILRRSKSVLAIKGGHNDEPHNHNDVGSFMYIKDGVIIAEDLGAPNYDKNYFIDEYRYGYFNAASFGHSLPIINGCYQVNGADYKADAFSRIDDNKIVVSFVNAYGKEAGITSLVRTVNLSNDGGLCVSDGFIFTADNATVVERLITRCGVVVGDGEFKLTKDGVTVATITPLHGCKISVSNNDDVMIIDMECKPKGRSLIAGYVIL